MALAPSTKNNYTTAFDRYQTFCRHHNINPIPASEETLIAYSTDLSYSLAHDSIKVHLAAIAFHAAISSHAIEFKQYKKLYYVLRGIKRSQGKSKKRRKRAPITPNMLKTININLFNSGRQYEDKLMLWAALLTAFYGFQSI